MTSPPLSSYVHFYTGGQTIVAATHYNRDYDCSDSLDAPGQPPRPAHPGPLSPRRHCRCPLARLRGRHPTGHPTLSARHRTPSPHHRTPSPHHRTPSPHHRNALPSPPQRPRFHHRNAPASTTAPCCSCRSRGPATRVGRRRAWAGDARGPRALCAASSIKARVMGVPRPPAIARSPPRARARRRWRRVRVHPGPHGHGLIDAASPVWPPRWRVSRLRSLVQGPFTRC